MPLTEEEYTILLRDGRDYSLEAGYNYCLSIKLQKKIELNTGRIFLLQDKLIRGYGFLGDPVPLDEDQRDFYHGQIWRHMGKWFITWRKSYWYKTPIKYTKQIKRWHYKYINIKKILNNEMEPIIYNDAEVDSIRKSMGDDINNRNKGWQW